MDNGTIALVGVALACVGQMVLAVCVAALFWESNKLVVVVGSILLGKVAVRQRDETP